jgi:hypothetical protein
VTVTASKSGFYPMGKPSAVEHELLDVLKKQSGAFTQVGDTVVRFLREYPDGWFCVTFRHSVLLRETLSGLERGQGLERGLSTGWWHVGSIPTGASGLLFI